MKIHEVVLLAESANTLFAVKVIDPKTGDEKTMEISALTATEAKSKVAGRTVDVDGEKKHYKVISVKNAWSESKASKQRLDPKCWTGKHKEGTKIKGGVRVNNCVPNESVGDVVDVYQHRSGVDLGKYGTFNIERETPTIIVVYDHNTKESLKFNRATGRGIGPASQLMIKHDVAEAANPAQQAAIAIAKNKEKDVDEAIARKDRPVPSIQLAMKRSEKIPNSKVIKLGPNRGFIVVDRSDPRPEVKLDLNVLGKVNNAETRYKDLLSQMRRLEREYDVHGSTDWRERQERFRKMVQDTNYEQLKALKQAATAELKTQKAYQRHEETGDVSEGSKTGPKFTGYYKGTDKGKPGKKMVGDA